MSKKSGISASRAASAAMGAVIVLASAAAPAQGIEEVVVTAQRREQSVQDVGIAVSAFSGDQLQRFGVTDSTALSAQTPGLASGTVAGSSAIVLFNIRGVNQNDFNDQHESPIAVYIDDAYVASMTAAGFMLFDLDRVEVLKGPQGTLFGRNTTGGLLHFISAAPTDYFSGHGNLTVASYDQVQFEGAVSGPLSEALLGRLSVVGNFSDGYLENRIGEDRHGNDFYAFRTQLLWKINDDAELLLKGHYSLNDREATGAYTNMPSRPGADGRGVPLAPDDPFWGAAPGGDLFGYRDNDGDPLTEAQDFLGFLDREIYGGTGKLTWEFENMTLVSVTDYRRVDKVYAEDAESSPNPLLNFATSAEFDQFSQELRLNGELDRMRWVAGFYYMSNDGKYGSKIWDAPLMTDIFAAMPGSTFDVTNRFELDKENWSVFGQIEYDILPELTFIGGVRYAKDDLDFALTVYDPGSLAVGGVSTVFQVFDSATVGGLANTKEDLVNWKTQLEWRPMDDVLLYAGITEGTKGPGFSSNLDATKALADIPYDSETLRNYEGGVKSTVFDGTTRINASVYHYDYSDYQSFDLSGLVTRIENVDATITGLELDIHSSPWEGWEFMFGANILFEADADDVPLGAGAFDREMPLAPDVTLNGMARYSFPAFGGTMSVQGDFNYVSSQNFAIQNHATTAADGYVIGNARLSWLSPDEHWEAAFFVQNLADEEYRTYAIDVSVFSFTQLQYGKPRWFGGQISYRWE